MLQTLKDCNSFKLNTCQTLSTRWLRMTTEHCYLITGLFILDTIHLLLVVLCLSNHKKCVVEFHILSPLFTSQATRSSNLCDMIRTTFCTSSTCTWVISLIFGTCWDHSRGSCLNKANSSNNCFSTARNQHYSVISLYWFSKHGGCGSWCHVLDLHIDTRLKGWNVIVRDKER